MKTEATFQQQPKFEKPYKILTKDSLFLCHIWKQDKKKNEMLHWKYPTYYSLIMLGPHEQIKFTLKVAKEILQKKNENWSKMRENDGKNRKIDCPK